MPHEPTRRSGPRDEVAYVEVMHTIRRSARSAPPSARAQILLVASAFLSGAALAGLLFVGIWRHTAADGDRAKAQWVSAQHAAAAARQRATVLATQLTQERVETLAVQRRIVTAQRAFTKQRDALAALDRSLTPRLTATQRATSALARKLSALQSELAALQSYVRAPGATGLDSRYLLTQLRYLSASAAEAISAASGAARSSQASADLTRAAHGH